MKRLTVAAAFALVLTSCASLGREYPRCDFPFIDIPISIVMQLQATPDAAVGVCLNDLEPGWTYHHMRHESGRSSFWLDSDRLGDRFVGVVLSESCDPGSAAARPHPNADVMRFVDATEETLPVDVVVVPTIDSVVDGPWRRCLQSRESRRS